MYGLTVGRPVPPPRPPTGEFDAAVFRWQTPPMGDELETDLIAQVLAAGLPPQEPLMRWLAWAESKPTHALPREQELRIRAGDHALLVGAVEYHCLANGRVEVKDMTDPRSMRFQVYDPRRPGQPYMHPSVELDSLA